MTFGVTDSGFILKRIDDIWAEIETELKVSFGENIDLAADTPLGQLVAIVAEARANDWLAMQAVYNSFYPDTSSGVSLDRVASLNNITRRNASYSTGALTFTGTDGVTVSAGIICTDELGRQVATISEGVITGGTTTCLCRATDSGAIEFAENTITKLVTSAFGVETVNNSAKIEGGLPRETDQEFRVRRKTSLQNPGTSGIDGIKNAVNTLDFMIDCIVNENATDFPDANGVPPHAFQVFVLTNLNGGITDFPSERSQVAKKIWDAKPAGIQTFGILSDTAQDGQGYTQTVYYSEAQNIVVNISLTVTANIDAKEGELFPMNGVEQIVDAIVAYVNTLAISRDVWLNKIYQAASSVAGVKGVSSVLINGASSNLPISLTELATISPENIIVTVV